MREKNPGASPFVNFCQGTQNAELVHRIMKPKAWLACPGPGLQGPQQSSI